MLSGRPLPTCVRFLPAVHEHDACRHFVHFYERGETLVRTAGYFLARALNEGHMVQLVLRPAHRQAIEAELTTLGLDLPSLLESGQFDAWDTADVLAKIIVDGMPDEARVWEAYEPMTAHLRVGRTVCLYGDPVAALLEAGNVAAALAMERMVGQANVPGLYLYCAYPLESFSALWVRAGSWLARITSRKRLRAAP